MEPLYLKLRCTSWSQVAALYRRDLSKGRLFLQTNKAVPPGAPIRIDLALPSDSIVALKGVVSAPHERPNDEIREGIFVTLEPIPQSALWMIETALSTRREMSIAGEAFAKLGIELKNDENAAAEQEVLSALDKEYVTLKKSNPFQILGVSYGATEEHIHAAFAQATKTYHPDRYAKFASTRVRQLAADIFLLIRDAYQSLQTDEARRQAASAARPPAPRAVPALSQPPSNQQSGMLSMPPRRIDIPVMPPAPAVGAALDPPTPLRHTPIPKEASLPGVGLPRLPSPAAVVGKAPAATPRPIPDLVTSRVKAPPMPPPGAPTTPSPNAPSTRAATSPAVPRIQPSSAKVEPSPATTLEHPSVAPPTVIPGRAPTVQQAAVAPPTVVPGRAPTRQAEAVVAPTELPGARAAAPMAVASNPTAPTAMPTRGSAADGYLDSGDYDKALALYRAALRANPTDENALAGVELAEGYKALGMRDRLEAAQRFEAVLEIDPSNERAARALADMRTAAANERKGMMSKLMGKKE